MRTNEAILKKIRKALVNRTSVDYLTHDFDKEMFLKSELEPELEFAEKFIENGGEFIFCENKNDFFCNLNDLLSTFSKPQIVYSNEKLEKFISAVVNQEVQDGECVLISECELLISKSGTIAISSNQFSERKKITDQNVHVIVAYTSQMVKEMKAAFTFLRGKYKRIPSSILFISGPSKTSDIEQKTVVGVHGAKSLYLFLIDNTQNGLR